MNEIEQKEIEEMARFIDSCETRNYNECLKVAKYLVEKLGYRNCKDKVVLSKEEQERILNATEKRIKQLKKELNDYKQRYESSEKRYEQLVQSSCEALEKKDKVVFERKEYEDKKKRLLNVLETSNLQFMKVVKERDKLKEELAKASELKAETIKLAKQETAREILQALKNMAYRSNDWSHGTHPMVVEVDTIEELAEKYGVEVE